MSYGQRGHLRKVLRNYQRRLHLLEQREAVEGLHTPPEILIEIQDIRSKISRIEKVLNVSIPNRTSSRTAQRIAFPGANNSTWIASDSTSVRNFPDSSTVNDESANSSGAAVMAVLVVVVVVGIIIALLSSSSASETIDGLIAFETNRDGNNEIYSMSPDGTLQKNLTNNSAEDFGPSWSPDGQHIAFVSYRDGNGEIYVMNADGSKQKRLTFNNADDGTPVWSPNGNQIAYMSNVDGDYEIFVMNSDGNEQIQLTNNLNIDRSPTWSPDSQHIAYVSNADGSWDIYAMNSDGTNPTRLTTTPSEERMPAWSPDGKYIAFGMQREDSQNFAIYVMNSDGTEAKNISLDNSDDQSPSWSLDSQRISFTSNRDNSDNYEIYLMNKDGSHVKKITDVSGRDRNPSWSLKTTERTGETATSLAILENTTATTVESLVTETVSPMSDRSTEQSTETSSTLDDSLEVIKISKNLTKSFFSDEISIELQSDVADLSSIVQITVRSKGYVRQTFKDLKLGDTVNYKGKYEYQILISDMYPGNVFNPSEIEATVTKVQLLDSTIVTNDSQEISEINKGSTKSFFNDELNIEFNSDITDLSSTIQIIVRSKGYIRRTFDNLKLGNEIVYEGKHKYRILISDMYPGDVFNLSAIEIVVKRFN